jgi:hypothetical protein
MWATKWRQVVVVDQLRVAEDPRLLSEQLPHQPPVRVDLAAELLARVQERERVVVRLAEELDAAGVAQPLKALEHLRRRLADLLQRGAGDRERDAEAALVLADGVEQRLVGGEVAGAGHLATQLGVLRLVEVVTVGVENAIPAEPERLVDLESRNRPTPYGGPFEYRPAASPRARPGRRGFAFYWRPPDGPPANPGLFAGHVPTSVGAAQRRRE